MIESICEIGRYLKEKEQLDTLTMLLEPLQLTADSKVLALVFSIGEKAVLKDVVFDDFDKGRENLYLYRKGSSRGSNITPIAKIVPPKNPRPGDSKIEKTLEIKITYWFKQNADSGPISSKINEYFSTLSSDEKKELLSKLDKEYEKFNPKLQHLLTIKILEEGRELYIGELEEFRAKFLAYAKERFSEQSSKGRSEGDGLCLLCNSQKQVLGFASPFTFYNVDQRGFVYHFRQTNSWKQLPLCLDCTLALHYGKSYLDKKLLFKFYGFQYYFIPKFFFTEVESEILNDIEDFSFKDQKKYEEGPLKEETNWQKILLKKGDVLSLIFLFFEKSQSRIIIRQYIEDVAPSWLNRLLTSFNDLLKSTAIFQEPAMINLLGKKAKGNGNFRQVAPIWKRYITIWSLVREFYPSSKKDGIYDKYFIDIVGDILNGTKINEKFLIKSFSDKFHLTFNKGKGELNWELAFNSLQALLLHAFLGKNTLLSGETIMVEDTIIKNEKLTAEYMKRIKDFFDEHAKALNTYEKKATFLQGVLTRFLVAIQYRNLNSSPFLSKLYGLQLDRRKLTKLLPQVVAKLTEYNIHYPELEELIAKYYLAIDDTQWNLTADETSYYFTLGLTLGQTFKGNSKEE